MAAQENLKKIKFINKNLPAWMRVPNLSKSEIKTYLELQNGSRVDTFYPFGILAVLYGFPIHSARWNEV